MSQPVDLSNARIVEWESLIGAPQVAIRNKRGEPFTSTAVFAPLAEEELSPNNPYRIAQNIRIVEEFPPRTLEEIVGDAQAFSFVSSRGEYRRLAARSLPDNFWWVANTRYVTLRELEAHKAVDLDSVVPLYPRVAAEEVVS